MLRYCIDSAIPLHTQNRHISRYTHSQTDTHMPIFIAALFTFSQHSGNNLNVHQQMTGHTEGGMFLQWNACYNTDGPEGITLSEKASRQRTSLICFHLHERSRTGTFTETENRAEVTGCKLSYCLMLTESV